MTRQWDGYAANRVVNDERVWFHFNEHPRYVEMNGGVPVEVVAIEDPDGTHFGWLGFEEIVNGKVWSPADTSPVMVQPRWSVFTMQFPYGPETEVGRGKGEIVRLRIEQR